MKIETICVQGGYDPKSGDTRTLPLYQSTTYYYKTPEELAHLFDVPKDGHIYSRISNPTTNAFEEKIAMLEGGDFPGCLPFSFSSALQAFSRRLLLR